MLNLGGNRLNSDKDTEGFAKDTQGTLLKKLKVILKWMATDWTH